MVRITAVSVGVLLCLINVPSFAKTPLGTVSTIIGAAMIRHDGDSAWIKAKIRTPVYENDAIAVKEESRCEITFHGDKVARLGENTLAVITEKSADQTKIKALKGTLWINVKHLIDNKGFTVATPTAVAAIRGTVFSVTCDSNASDYLVFRGVVAVSKTSVKDAGRDSTFTVKSGEQFALVKDINLYMKEQEKEIKDYLQQSNEELDKFSKEEQDQYDKYQKDMQEQMEKMLTEERAAFKTMDNMNYSLRPIDEKKLAKSLWAQWNRERDKELGW